MTKPDYNIPDELLDESLAEQLRALDEKLRMPEKRPGEFTAREYQIANQLTDNEAKTRLRRGVEMGEISKRKEKRSVFYSFIEQE